MPKTRLYLIRHGQVEGHEEKRYNGQGNVALTPVGKIQSEKTCQALSDSALQAVYSSDLYRCYHCARLIGEEHRIQVVRHPGLREVHVGNWEGRTCAELQKTFPVSWKRRIEDLENYRIPGGESLKLAADRVRPVMRQILANHAGAEVAIVAHGGINRIILLDALGAPLKQAFSIEQDYGCINIIEHDQDGHAVVKLLNSTAHQNNLNGVEP